MKNARLGISTGVLLLLFLNVNGQQSSCYERFNLKDLLAQQRSWGAERVFLSKTTLNGKLIHVKRGLALKGQYTNDAVCFVIKGSGKLKLNNDSIFLHKGGFVYMPRRALHAFYDVEFPLDIIIFESLENKSLPDTSDAIFSLRQVQAARQTDSVVWNPFLKRPSMIFGLYMLPRKLNGDDKLTHQWDEVNLITKGRGKFQIGNDILDVKPGDIVYVEKGNGHFFHTLRSDLDILIFFEKRSLQEQDMK